MDKKTIKKDDPIEEIITRLIISGLDEIEAIYLLASAIEKIDFDLI